MTQVRIGVIGVGWWGTVGHLEPLSANPQVEIAAIWSRTEGKAQARAEQYGVPRHYTDYRKMIDEAELDGVVIASTPNMHFEQARYALERGLHVLVEKPFVLCAEHAMELRRLATQGNRLLSVCHPVLFMPAMIRARELVRSGALGQLVMVSAVHAQRVYDLYKGDVETVFDQRPGMPRPNDLSYADPSIVGGGEGHTQASHIVGTILWLTGLEPTYVYCAMNPLDTQVDVIDAMVIRFSNGCLAAVGANGLLPAGVAARGAASRAPARQRTHHTAVVRTAIPLTEDQVEALVAAITKRVRGTIELEQEVDPKVIGGVWMRIDDTIIDGSIRGRIELLRRHLCVQCRVILQSGFAADSFTQDIAPFEGQDR